MKKAVLLFAFCFATTMSLVATGGVHSVGKGGGLAELQFIQYFSEAKKVVDFCLSQPGNCELSAKQIKTWTQLSQLSKNIVKNYRISYETTASQSWRVSGTTIIVNSPALYIGNESRSQAEIFAFAIAIQLNLIHPESDFESLFEQTKLNLKKIRFAKKTTNLSVGLGNVSFHRMSMLVGENSFTLLVLEDESKSILLNDLLLIKYPSLDLNSLNLTQVESVLSANRILFYGFASGRSVAGIELFSDRRFQISAFLQADQTIDESTLNFLISAE